MGLNVTEVRPGCIAYFDAQSLNSDPQVQRTGDPVTRRGPTSQFVCYKVDGGRAFWAPLTGTFRNERLRIDEVWVSPRYGTLGDGGAYLQDGKNTYSGPVTAFVAASGGEVLHGPRPYVSAAGVAAIVAEVISRGGAT